MLVRFERDAGKSWNAESPVMDRALWCVSRPEKSLQGRTEVYEREGESEV